MLWKASQEDALLGKGLLMNIEIPKKAYKILNALENAGYEAYVVGGCVRDSLLGIKPDDWDITTSATPDQVKEVFSRTVDTGIKHGTVSVICEGELFEVTTYRIDGDYTDGRHPEWVTYTSNLVEDLKRRDFTVNAMAYNPMVGIVDLFGGVDDLRNKVIRAVGNPIERFKEDALRMLRAIRFAAKYGFEIEEETYAAIGVLKDNLSLVSSERINQELTKTLLSQNPGHIKYIEKSGLMPYVCDGLRTDEAVIGLSKVEPDIALRLSIALKTYGGPEPVKAALRKLKYDNKTIKRVVTVVDSYDKDIPTDSVLIKKWMFEKGADAVMDIYKCHMVLRESEELKASYREYERILRDKEPYSLSMLPICGKDLMDMGYPHGKRIGDELLHLLELVMEDKDLCNRDSLMAIARMGMNPNEN